MTLMTQRSGQGAGRRQGGAPHPFQVRGPTGAAQPRDHDVLAGSGARHRQPGRGARIFRTVREDLGTGGQGVHVARGRRPAGPGTPCQSTPVRDGGGRATGPRRAGRPAPSARLPAEGAGSRGFGAHRRRLRVVRRPPTTSSPSTSSRGASCAGRAGGVGRCRPRRSSFCVASSAEGSPPPCASRPGRWPTSSPNSPPRRRRCIWTGVCAVSARARRSRWRAWTAFGVYVHVPFCSSRCDYCAFATWTDRDHLMARYAEACVTEIGRAVTDEGLPRATSIFVGGGTPSRLPADLLADDPRRRPPGGRGRGHGGVQSRGRLGDDRFAVWRSAGREPGLVRGAVDGPPRPRRPGTAPRPRLQVASGLWPSPVLAGFASVNVDLIFGGCRGDRRRLGRHSLEAVLALDPVPRT